jgi:hypothetical protein
MHTHVVRPALPCDEDRHLLDRLRPLKLPVDHRAGAIRIGIENRDGALYRVIETSSVVEAVRIFETLNALRLEPCIGSSERPDFTRVFRAESHGH